MPSDEEKAVANQNHINWLQEAPTKRVIESLRNCITTMPLTVTGVDSREAFYAHALKNAGLLQALQRIEAIPFPNIQRG